MRLIVTNNPKVRQFMVAQALESRYQLLWVEGYVEDVLRNVRDLCHKNYKLITHPLTGSIKPNQTPYKTAVLEKKYSQRIDLQSVLMAENSLSKALEMLADKPRPEMALSFAEDYAVIDLDFFKSYLSSAADYPS